MEYYAAYAYTDTEVTGGEPDIVGTDCSTSQTYASLWT